MFLSSTDIRRVLEAMEAKAIELGARAGSVAIMCISPGSDLLNPIDETHHLSINGNFWRPPDPARVGDAGTNYRGVVGGKLAEMLRTEADSGRSMNPMKGELGYPGGVIINPDGLKGDGNVYYAACSGLPNMEDDLTVAEHGKSIALSL